MNKYKCPECGEVFDIEEAGDCPVAWEEGWVDPVCPVCGCLVADCEEIDENEDDVYGYDDDEDDDDYDDDDDD